MATRVIPEETIAQVRALARAGTSKKKIAAQFGLSRDTVRRYVAGELPGHASETQVASLDEQVSQRISDNFDLFLTKATDVLASDEFVARMALRPKDLALGVAIVTDKRELLAGRPTGRNLTIQVSLVRPGALKALEPDIVEGEYRTFEAASAGAAPALVAEVNKT